MESVEESITILSRVSRWSTLLQYILIFMFWIFVILLYYSNIFGQESMTFLLLTYFSTFQQEGFDYEFVPPLDPKYECAICLLGLRSPIQTTCGHRFCKDCIFNCMRYCDLRKNLLCINTDNLSFCLLLFMWLILVLEKLLLEKIVLCANSVYSFIESYISFVTVRAVVAVQLIILPSQKLIYSPTRVLNVRYCSLVWSVQIMAWAVGEQLTWCI